MPSDHYVRVTKGHGTSRRSSTAPAERCCCDANLLPVKKSTSHVQSERHVYLSPRCGVGGVRLCTHCVPTTFLNEVPEIPLISEELDESETGPKARTKEFLNHS